MSGLWVFVCGPSGAGKDSVMNWAAAHLAERHDIVFSRRLVTRTSPLDLNHEAVSVPEFEQLRGADRLAWHWQAHGLHYGIGAHYAEEVAAGRIVVVNGSRAHANGLPEAPQVRVVQIVADAAALAARLKNRGREAPHEVTRRLVRNTSFTTLRADHTISNQGELADAGRQLADYLVAGFTS